MESSLSEVPTARVVVPDKCNAEKLNDGYYCICNRENLEKSIRIYTKQIGEETVSQILGEAKCGLAHLCFKMGEWSEGKGYLQEAEHLLDAKEEDEIVVCCNHIRLASINNTVLLCRTFRHTKAWQLCTVKLVIMKRVLTS